MNKSLRQALIDQFEQPSLTEQQFQQLETMQQSLSQQSRPQQTTPKKKFHRPFSGRLKIIAVSACVFTAVSVSLLLNRPFYSLPETNTYKLAPNMYMQTARAIAKEVVKNHLHMKPLDVQSANHSQVQAFFSMLDFSPIESSYYTKNRMMLGGRYCSIKGVTAAQLRFKSQHGQLETLYQVPYDAEFFPGLSGLENKAPPLILHERGLKVSLWVEKGLLMVSAQAPD